MNVRFAICFVGLFLLGSSLQAKEKPNVIVIFTDDHGYADLSSQGVFDDIRTPHIDKLASGGARMTSGYVTAPQCVPSRAGLLSGRYQNRFGLESNKESLNGFNQQQTLADRLKAVGYATGMSGKWHLGPPPQIVEHGFDQVYYKNRNGPGWANFDLNGMDRAPGPENSKLYHVDVNSAAACAFIERHHDRPFFFYCAYRAPHVPLDAPKKYLDRFPGKMPQRRRQALAMLSAIDDGVGNIVATLRKHNLEEKTLLFFIGDNGAPLKIHKLDAPGGGPGWDGSLNDPYNGEKGMLSEGGIRVPFVVAWKGTIPGGQVVDEPVISLDVAATACAAAGLVKDDALDGADLTPLLRDRQPLERELYWRWISQAAIRDGDWKLLRGGNREYLFNLKSDGEEKQNLLEQHPQIAARLKQKLTKWSQQMSPPGLQTQAMSQTWEDYFDFYLEGKPAPKPKRPAAGNSETRFQGWVVRSAEGKLTKAGLNLQGGPQKRRPFIAANGLKLPPGVSVSVKTAAALKGKLTISWRESGQKDFVQGQSVTGESMGAATTIKLTNSKTAIHLRIMLPVGSTVESIECRNSNGKQVNRWNFGAR